MARAKTLLELRTRIRHLADAGPATTTGRHTTTELNTEINASWQQLREMMSEKGHYLKSAVATMTAGATSPFAFGTITMPADCVRVMGVDVMVSANEVRALLPIMFLERNESYGIWGQQTGIPTGFMVTNIGVELTTGVTPGTIIIVPPPNGAYTYALWYLPAWTDITDDTFVFDGVAGWDDWVVYDVVLKLAMADNDMANTAAIASQMKGEAKDRLMTSVNSTQAVGPARRIDVAGMRSRNQHNTRFRWP